MSALIARPILTLVLDMIWPHTESLVYISLRSTVPQISVEIMMKCKDEVLLKIGTSSSLSLYM